MPICMLVRMGVANVDKRLYSIVDILVERRISGRKFCIVLYCIVFLEVIMMIEYST